MGREAYERNRVGFVALYVADLAAQRDAMVNGLGLEVRFEEADLVVFAMEGTDLVLHRAHDETAALAGQTRFGFYSLDLDTELDSMRSVGLSVHDDCDSHPRSVTATLPGGQALELVGR